MAGIYRLQTDFPNVIIHFHIHLFGSTVAQTPSERGFRDRIMNAGTSREKRSSDKGQIEM